MLEPLHPLREGKGEGLYHPGKAPFPCFLSHLTLFIDAAIAMRMQTIVGAVCLGSGDTCEYAPNFLGL
jgi:hypothetical protein